MKTKLLNNFLAFALFGLALGYFGMLYEGLVLIPKMLNSDLDKLQFWRDFYKYINPVVFYIPVVPISTITIIFLFFKINGVTYVKQKLKFAILFQLLALGFTFYIVTQINFRHYLNDIGKNFDLINKKVVLVNAISVIRLIFAFTAVRLTFLSYVHLHKQNQ